MKDDVSIRITFSERGREAAQTLIDFLEEHVEHLAFQSARKGNNPKYQPGGKSYDEGQGEFWLSYSRLSIRKGVSQLPEIKKPQRSANRRGSVHPKKD